MWATFVHVKIVFLDSLTHGKILQLIGIIFEVVYVWDAGCHLELLQFDKAIYLIYDHLPELVWVILWIAFVLDVKVYCWILTWHLFSLSHVIIMFIFVEHLKSLTLSVLYLNLLTCMMFFVPTYLLSMHVIRCITLI